MDGRTKTKKQLLNELTVTRQRIVELEASAGEREHSEEALEDGEELYRSLYENTPVMMHSIDREGRLIYVNNHWLNTLGYRLSEVIGRQSTEFLTNASRRYAIEVKLPEFYETGYIKIVEYQMVKKNGQVIDVLLSANAQRDEAGQIVHTLANIVDLSQRRHSEVLAEIGRIISSSLDIDEVYERFAQQVRKLIPFDRITISCIDYERGTMTDAYVRGVDVPDWRPGSVTPLAGSNTEEVIRTKTSVLIQTEDIDAIRSQVPALAPGFQAGLRSFFSVPLVADDRVVGVLHLRSPLEEKGMVEFMDGNVEIIPGLNVKVTDGPSAGHQIVLVERGSEKVAYVSDLIPTPYHLPLPCIPAMHEHPNDTLVQKKEFLDMAINGGWLVIFGHGQEHRAGYVQQKNGNPQLTPVEV